MNHLNYEIKEILNEIGINELKPVQLKTLPLMMQNQDIIVESPTGSGKTLAFVLPIVNYILLNKSNLSRKKIHALVIAPTRELAIQINEEFKHFNVETVCIIGGSDNEIFYHEENNSDLNIRNEHNNASVLELEDNGKGDKKSTYTDEHNNASDLEPEDYSKGDIKPSYAIKHNNASGLELEDYSKGDKKSTYTNEHNNAADLELEDNGKGDISDEHKKYSDSELKDNVNFNETKTENCGSKINKFVQKGKYVKSIDSNKQNQKKKLSNQKFDRVANICVGTPGKLNSIITSNQKLFSSIKFLILDEADKLLTMGLGNTVSNIIKLIPKQRLAGLFTATMDCKVTELSKLCLKNPVKINFENEQIPERLCMYYIKTEPFDKIFTLLKIFHQIDRKIIVFFASCASVDFFYSLFDKILKFKFKSIMSKRLYKIHRKLSNELRQKVYKNFFEDGDVLFCTDIASRGIDFKEIDTVIHFDMPLEPEIYIHRSGRTARNGETGKSILLIMPNELTFLNFLELKNINITEYKGVDNDYKEENCQNMENMNNNEGIKLINKGNSSEFKENLSPDTNYKPDTVLLYNPSIVISTHTELSKSIIRKICEDSLDCEVRSKKIIKGNNKNADKSMVYNLKGNMKISTDDIKMNETCGKHDKRNVSIEIDGFNGPILNNIQCKEGKHINLNQLYLSYSEIKPLIDRVLLKVSIKSFVSYIRSYKEHTLSYIFRLKELNFDSLISLFFLEKVPQMNELKNIKFERFPRNNKKFSIKKFEKLKRKNLKKQKSSK